MTTPLPRRVGAPRTGPVLVPTEVACVHIGRPRTTLYRWAREGRIRRYGTRAERLWDLRDIKDQWWAPGVDAPFPDPPGVRYPPQV